MRDLRRLSRTVLVSVPVAFWMLGAGGGSNALVIGVAEAQSTACGLSQPAFCDTFDQPAGTGTRAGQLSPVWGVSRINETDTNAGQGQFDGWSATQLQTCSGTTAVQAGNDVIICNGQLRQAINDNQSLVTLAMYPKQPFDFAGRTGTIAFDVSNDTLGLHSEWPEVWITDQPVPAPFTFFTNVYETPRNGLGLRLGEGVVAQQGTQLGGTCPNDANPRWTTSRSIAVRNYAVDDEKQRAITGSCGSGSG